MVNDLVIILVLIVILMCIVDYSNRPPKSRQSTMDDDG